MERIDVSRVILGCDAFISWLYQGGDSPFKRPDGNLDVLKALEVMKTSVSYGVKSLDLSPPLVEAFVRLREETHEDVVGLGALQEWTCKNFTIDGAPLEDYNEEMKATVRSTLPSGYLEHLAKSRMSGAEFIQSFFAPNRKAQRLTKSQIDTIEMKPEFFKRRLELYRKLNVKLVQFGGITADWLVGVGRIDLLEKLLQLIRRRGFAPVLICHWTTLVLPVCEKELEGISGYIVPVNKLWGLLTLRENLRVIKNTEKPVIAMKTLARGALSNEIESAFTFLFKKARVAAVMVGVSSEKEAKQTFSAIGKALKRY
jgi:hypothetical protein